MPRNKKKQPIPPATLLLALSILPNDTSPLTSTRNIPSLRFPLPNVPVSPLQDRATLTPSVSPNNTLFAHFGAKASYFIPHFELRGMFGE